MMRGEEPEEYGWMEWKEADCERRARWKYSLMKEKKQREKYRK